MSIRTRFLRLAAGLAILLVTVVFSFGVLIAACTPFAENPPAQEVGRLELKWPPPGEPVDSAPVLQWQDFPGAARYRVVVTDDGGSPRVALDQLTGETNLAVTPPLAPGSYRWTVQGQDANAVVLAELQSQFTVKARLELLAPADGAVVDRSPALSWASFPGATHYQVVVVDSDAYPPLVVLEQTTAGTSLAVATLLKPGTGYSLTIRALGANGITLAESNSAFKVKRSTIDLVRCSIGGVWAECGTYRVYENRAARSGRAIDLRIAVLPATGEPRAPDPIFYLAGGPGGSAVDALPDIGPALAGLNKHRDLVFVDQRGTGQSNKLVCPEPNGALDLSDAAAMESYAKSCLATLPGDPGWYTTRAFADDLDDVRQAFGYEQINLVGGSYGATSAQVYLLHHEGHLRTMAMMGGTLLDFPIFEHPRQVAPGEPHASGAVRPPAGDRHL